METETGQEEGEEEEEETGKDRGELQLLTGLTWLAWWLPVCPSLCLSDWTNLRLI